MRLVLTYCYNIYSFQNIPTIQQFFIKFIQRFEFDWRELFELMELARPPAQTFHFFSIHFLMALQRANKSGGKEWTCRASAWCGVAFISSLHWLFSFLSSFNPRKTINSRSAASLHSLWFVFDFMSWLVWFFFSFSSFRRSHCRQAGHNPPKERKRKPNHQSFNPPALH